MTQAEDGHHNRDNHLHGNGKPLGANGRRARRRPRNKTKRVEFTNPVNVIRIWPFGRKNVMAANSGVHGSKFPGRGG